MPKLRGIYPCTCSAWSRAEASKAEHGTRARIGAMAAVESLGAAGGTVVDGAMETAGSPTGPVPGSR